MKGPQARQPELIAEWKSRVLEGRRLSASDRVLVDELSATQDARLVVRELRSGVEICAKSWVGLVRFEEFDVCIVPKLAGENLGLVEMVQFTSGLDALKEAPRRRTLQTGGESLLDLIALLLAEACEQVVRGGLLADYVEREGDLPVVRGRILADQQVLRRFGRADRIICRHDEHEQDIVENQLLAAALAQCASRVQHEETRQRVRRQLAIFREVCEPEALDVRAARSKLTYHRLNEHYRDAHTLALLVLDGLGTNQLLAPGRTDCFAFLIDMNRLFEMFVYRLVERLLDRSAVRVHYQRGDRSIIVNATTREPYSRVIPDLLIEADGKRRIAIDAKYKLYDQKKLDNGDVYQSFLYAYAYGGAEQVAPVALLVYPSTAGSQRTVRLRIRGPGEVAPEIFALGLSIPYALREIAAGSDGPACDALLETVAFGLGMAGVSLVGRSASRRERAQVMPLDHSSPS